MPVILRRWPPAVAGRRPRGPPPPPVPPRRTLKRVAVLAVTGLGLVALIAYLTWSGYRGALRGAETTTRNYALIIEARLDATLRRADTHLQEMARDVPLAALGRSAVPRYAGGIEPALEMRLQNFPELTALRVFDAGGDMLYASDSRTAARVNIADRAHFRQTRDAPPDSLVFSEVLTARTTGHQSLFVERALRDRQGAFRGVVTATIELEYFQKLFQSLDMGPHGVISIYRRDDFTQVVRRPPGGVGTNTPLPPGNPTYGVAASGNKISTLEFPASTDGVVRTYSYDLLDRYPFFVTVGLAHEDVLAAWRTRSLAVGAAVLLLLLLLTGTMIRLWRPGDRLGEASAAAGAPSPFKSAFLPTMLPQL